MNDSEEARGAMRRRLVDTLFTDALLIADEARGYFDDRGRGERDMLDPALRVGFSCEALKVTTRLLYVIAWLMTQRAVAAGELTAEEALHPSRRLGEAPESDAALGALMPANAQRLMVESAALYDRTAAHATAIVDVRAVSSPVGAMHALLSARF